MSEKVFVHRWFLNTYRAYLMTLIMLKQTISGATIRIWGGGGLEFFGNKIFVGKMGEINKWPQAIVEINILSTKEVEINII